MTTPKTWVAMTATTREQQLVGIDLFIAELGEQGRWRFRHHAETGPTDQMRERIGDSLPPEAALIGWNVDKMLVPAVLVATADAAPEIAAYFAARLYRLLRGGAIDLALCHGGSAAPSIVKVATSLGIELPATIRVDDALTLWRMFVRSAGIAGLSAEAATDTWLTRRASISASAATPVNLKDEQQEMGNRAERKSPSASRPSALNNKDLL